MSRRLELTRAVAYLAAETHRFEADVLGDVEAIVALNGDAPDAALCEVVRAERERARTFRKVVDQHAARLRGRR